MSTLYSIPTRKLQIGMRLQHPIPDPENPQVHLLTEGAKVTDDFLDRLMARGITTVALNTRDLVRINSFQPQGRAKIVPKAHEYQVSRAINQQTLMMDEHLNHGYQFESPIDAHPFSESLKPPPRDSYDKAMVYAWIEKLGGTIDSVGDVLPRSPAQLAFKRYPNQGHLQ